MREPRDLAYHGNGVWSVIYRGGDQALVGGRRALALWLRIRWHRLRRQG